MKAIIRKLTPQILLQAFRNWKKVQTRKHLLKQKNQGHKITREMIVLQLDKLGVKKGSTVLVHSSMSKIGYLDQGPKTFVDALLYQVGTEGNILMPTSPNPKLQIDYIKENPVFDVNNTPSAMGAITEYFRKLPGVKRSASPTEPVAALGPQSDYLTQGHLYETTPYSKNSPFYRVAELGGIILYVGVTLDNAGTSLHVLEDAVNFKFPVYYPALFPVEVIDHEGVKHSYSIKVHNPEMSIKRKCDELLPAFEEAGIMKRAIIGKAETLVFDAQAQLDFMIQAYHKQGITMYTPHGSNE